MMEPLKVLWGQPWVLQEGPSGEALEMDWDCAAKNHCKKGKDACAEETWCDEENAEGMVVLRSSWPVWAAA